MHPEFQCITDMLAPENSRSVSIKKEVQPNEYDNQSKHILG